MIEGIGVDVVEIARLRQTIERWGETFLQRILTEKELSYVHSKQDSLPHIAGRFAVKEAVSKALATGWSGGFRWKDVEVRNDVAGKPSVEVFGAVKEALVHRRVHVSLSHAEHVVVGFAVIEHL